MTSGMSGCIQILTPVSTALDARTVSSLVQKLITDHVRKEGFLK